MNKILRLDASTGVQEKDLSLGGVHDLFLTTSGELLAGTVSFSTKPTFFDTDLNTRGTLDFSRQFVTQYVPEPSSVTLLTAAAGTLVLRRRR